MKEAQKNVREYLAAIGKRGGLWADTRTCEEDSRYSWSQTRCVESRKTVASSQPQTVKAQV